MRAVKLNAESMIQREAFNLPSITALSHFFYNLSSRIVGSLTRLAHLLRIVTWNLAHYQDLCTSMLKQLN